MKTIIIPSEPFNNKNPEPMFEAEYNSAKKFGNVFLLDFEEFVEGNLLKKFPKANVENKEIYYHGWMMDINQYKNFYTTLGNKGYRLTNNPTQYAGFHYFDGWYSSIEGLTPQSIMIDSDELHTILKATLQFQNKCNSDILIKDAVKSLKHDWFTACFIGYNDTLLAYEKVIENFLKIKKEHNDLKLPVVIRKFEKLVSIGKHPKSGMPISYEYRTYIHNGKIMFQTPYWDLDYKADQAPPKEFIQTLIDKITFNCSSELFTIDTALKQDGTWTCIEVGDGQVSALPNNADKDEFFAKLLGENK